MAHLALREQREVEKGAVSTLPLAFNCVKKEKNSDNNIKASLHSDCFVRVVKWDHQHMLSSNYDIYTIKQWIQFVTVSVVISEYNCHNNILSATLPKPQTYT